MSRVLKTALLLAAASALASCSSQTAGSLPSDGTTYGVAVQTNQLVQAAYGASERRLIAYADKFRAEATDTVTFDFDSARLDAEARRALDGQAAWLRANPTVRMRVYGHADKVGAESYNDRLGLRRARAVVRYLASKGVARNRLDAVQSLGERQPVVDTEERERRNRRAVTAVEGFAAGYVGPGLDGKRAALGYKEYTADKGEIAATEAVAAQ